MNVKIKFKPREHGIRITDTRKGFDNSNDCTVTVITIFLLLQELREMGMDVEAVIDDLTETFYSEDAKKSAKEVKNLIRDAMKRGMVNDFIKGEDYE